MFSGPMFRWEFQETTRRRRPFLYRTGIVVVLLIVMVLVSLVVFSESPLGGGRDAHELDAFGQLTFITTFSLQLLFLVFFVPAFVGGSIADEREKNTLPLLILTRLRPIEIVLTKMAARWLPLLSLILAGFPVLLASALLAGLESELPLALVMLLSSSVFMAALAIMASAGREQAAHARGQATGSIFGWLLGPPVLSILPIGAPSLWGALLDELKMVCALVAPSSPLSLVTDRGWYFRPQVVSLGERVAWMVGLQTFFGVLALGFAASHLKARERNPNWTDPTRGFRPPCGDDPIYWREYELPMRRGGGSIITLRLRYIMILVRAILMNLRALAMTLLLLAVPAGLLFTTIYYGFPAFQECWRHGYGSNEPFDHAASTSI